MCRLSRPHRDTPSPKGDGLDAELLDVTRVAKTSFEHKPATHFNLKCRTRSDEGDHATDSMTRSRKMRKSRGRMPLSARAELHAVRHADLELRCAQRGGSGPLTLLSIEHWLARATKTTCRRKTTRRPQASMSNPTPLSPLVTVRAGT